MSGLFRPVGHLPASAYWLRRVLLIGLVLLIGWALIAWLGPGSGADGKQPTAANASADKRETAEGTNADQTADENADSTGNTQPAGDRSGGSDDAEQAEKAENAEQAKAEAKSDQAAADKPDEEQSDPNDLGELPACPDDVLSAKVVPEKDPAEAGKPLDMRMTFTSDASESCKIPVSPDTVGLTIVSGSDPIWNTAECDTVIPTGPLSMQPGEPRVISVTWPGRRSTEGCPDETDAALPGYYLVELTLNDVALDSGRFRLF